MSTRIIAVPPLPLTTTTTPTTNEDGDKEHLV